MTRSYNRSFNNPVVQGQLAGQDTWQDIGPHQQQLVHPGEWGSWATPQFTIGEMIGRAGRKVTDTIGDIPGHPIGHMLNWGAGNRGAAALMGALMAGGAGAGIGKLKGYDPLLSGGLAALGGGIGSAFLSGHLQNVAAQNALANEPAPYPYKPASVRAKKATETTVAGLPPLIAGSVLTGAAGLSTYLLYKERQKEKARDKVLKMFLKAAEADPSLGLGLTALGVTGLTAGAVLDVLQRRRLNKFLTKTQNKTRGQLLQDPEYAHLRANSDEERQQARKAITDLYQAKLEHGTDPRQLHKAQMGIIGKYATQKRASTWNFPLDMSSPDLVTAVLLPNIGQKIMLDNQMSQEQKLTLNSLLPQLNQAQAESLNALIRRGIGGSVGAIVAKYLFNMGLGGMTLFGILGSKLADPGPPNYATSFIGRPYL